ncbi:MAG: serine hydrolase [Ferruginibacter sp.]
MKSFYYKHIIKILLVFFVVSCSTTRHSRKIPEVVTTVLPVADSTVKINVVQTKTADDIFFETLFKNYPGKFDSILLHKKEWNVQIIYTQINRDKNGLPLLKTYYFNKNNARYYYPASTVKFPTALLALQKLNELRATGISRNSTMITEAAFSGQTAVYNDPNTPDGRPSITQYIKKILLVSDNDAFNRVYEFLGQEYLNNELHKKGYSDAQILHRLDIFLTEDENRHTNPLSFYDSSNHLVYAQPMQFNTRQYERRTDSIGTAHYSKGILQNMPMNFSKKNRLSLGDLNTILTSVIFPQNVKPSQRFNITEDDRQFVLKYMSSFPGESDYPSYDSSYNDAWCKFILYGSAPGKLPGNIRIFNKVGDAYGQMIDAAYVVDYEKKIEFMVSAAVYCNTDEIMNDDKYDYNTIGYPFMKNLGRALYDFELRRKRDFIPDLTPFIFKYDK